jgi:hypothetical protein
VTNVTLSFIGVVAAGAAIHINAMTAQLKCITADVSATRIVLRNSCKVCKVVETVTTYSDGAVKRTSHGLSPNEQTLITRLPSERAVKFENEADCPAARRGIPVLKPHYPNIQIRGGSTAVLAAEFEKVNDAFKPGGLSAYVMRTVEVPINPAKAHKDVFGKELSAEPEGLSIAMKYWTERRAEEGRPPHSCQDTTSRVELRDQHGSPSIYINPEGVRNNVLKNLDVDSFTIGTNEAVAKVTNRNTETKFFARLIVSCSSELFSSEPS